MIAYILHSKDSSDREVKNFAEQLRAAQIEVELVDADSREGVDLTQNYDLVTRPSVALVASDGTLVERWQGVLPLVSDLSYLAHK